MRCSRFCQRGGCWWRNNWQVAMLYTKSLAVLMGSLMHTMGVWVLLDKHVQPAAWSTCSDDGLAPAGFPISCYERNVSLLVAGLALVIATNTVKEDFGVDPAFLRLLGMPAGQGRQKHLAAINQHEITVTQLKVIRLMLPRSASRDEARQSLLHKMAETRILSFVQQWKREHVERKVDAQ
ncbi:unnamed protein product [Polarella glacialis]|uniref:Uncharacterized protein n=1 Tax=Polarella glacialis TaxID=89957 RepID=A0A813ED61_POLGL|nr:unnamed protein product [Polarella glacialis]